MALDPVEVGKRIYESLGNPLVPCLEKKGITSDYLADKLKEELEANETKVFQYKGGIVEKSDLVAWEIRQRARIDAHKLLGHYPSEKHHVTFEDTSKAPLTPEEQERFEQWKRFEQQRAMEEATKK